MADTPSTPSGSGLAPNLAGALSYLLSPLTGIVFLVIEKNDRFVRFHAAQSIGFGVAVFVLSVALTVLGTVLAAVPLIGWLIGLALSLALGLGSFALWLLLMYRAYQGEEWELPVVGAQVRRYLSPVAIAP